METILNSKSAEELLHANLSTLDHEEAWSIYLSPRREVIGSEMVSKGTMTMTAIDCRTVMRQALLHNAASIILLHNHPGGNARPSHADIKFTGELSRACELLGVRLLDHIIVAGKSFYSFCDEKLYKNI